ncbi:MAG: hypothetical protein LC115_09845, partial [Bacteroidia bacterium]|nr:hypothetical protein [Bacteroidia bacterium]
ANELAKQEQEEKQKAEKEDLSQVESTLRAEINNRLLLEQAINQTENVENQTSIIENIEHHPELNRKSLVDQQNLLKSQLEKIKNKALLTPKEVDIQAIQNKFLKSILKNPSSQKPKNHISIPVPPPISEEKIEKKRPHSDIDNIIDRFIQLEPSLSSLGKQPVQQHTDFSIPEEETSSDYSFDIISETLAKIHEQQGNIDQAIKMYEKLAQKFPEKTTIFMAQIKRLKGE